MELRGSIAALVTPFAGNHAEKVNFDVLKALVDLHAANGTYAVAPCGTTGESPTLTEKEHVEILHFVTKAAHQKGLKVIAGTGSNNTREAIHFTEAAREAGADACLVVVPYYNKPTPEGLMLHFRELDKIGLPIVMYNIPGRTGINLNPEWTFRIAEACPNIVGLKASNGNLEEITEVIGLTQKLGRPFSVVSGDDALTLPIMAVGGTGVISVVANLVPAIMASLVEKMANGLLPEAQSLNHKIYHLCKALLTFGANPMGIKALMNRTKWEVGQSRLPLTTLTEEQEKALLAIYDETMQQLNA